MLKDMVFLVGQSTHGQHNRLRAPGSIGAVQHKLFKGMRMAGQTGNKSKSSIFWY